VATAFNFASDLPTGFTNLATAPADYAWTYKSSGGTPSGGTGPSGDANGDGGYYFTEATSRYNKKHVMEIDVDTMCPGGAIGQLDFKYHMSGGDMGTLQVTVGETYGASVVKWSKAGDQGSAWLSSGIVDVWAYKKLFIVGTTGTYFRSDMAFDDMRIACSSPGSSDPTDPIFAASPPPPSPVALAPGSTLIGWVEGDYPDECSFTLICSNGLYLTHSGAWTDTTTVYQVPLGTTCTLELADSYGDGWNGNAVTMWGNTYTISDSSASAATFTFTVDA